MIKKLNNYLLNKKGMTLVEVLTAMTILTLMIFCFAPLLLSYLQTINIAGDKMERVYKDAGVLEVLLGKNNLDSKYTVSIDTVPIKLTSPSAIITDENGGSQSVAEATIESFVKAYGLSSGGTFSKDNMGNQDVNGNIDISTGQSTFYTDKSGSASGITLFPSSLTDDFKTAYITIYSADINFVLGNCEFVTTGPTGEIKLTKGVDYDLQYHPDRKNATDTNILLLTVYGGGDKISFETSPLVFKHMGQRYEIQIDAPMMIMVGEKSRTPDADGNEYHYYVSRGEIDESGSLLIHRRVMNTTSDPKSGQPVTLNAPMNDVEWVPAESADAYSKDSSGDNYGYYVMCGDHGQVRRFWKRPDSTITVDGKQIQVDGNYYWGGDYTYYTDYNLNRFSGTNTYINTTDANGNASPNRVYSTDVSFKYIAMRPMFWDNGKTPGGNTSSSDADRMRTGFNMSSKKYTVAGLINNGTAHLRNLCTVSATYSSQVQFYGSDGKMITFVPAVGKKGANTTTIPTYDQNMGFYHNGGSIDGKAVSATKNESFYAERGRGGDFEAWGWLDPGDGTDSYYKIYGISDAVNKASYPITLTSVDAIQLTGSGAYETNVTGTDKSHYFNTNVIQDTDTSGDATAGSNSSAALTMSTNLKYPTASYTLYCGHIPAYMDVWAAVTGKAKYGHSLAFAGEDNGQYGKAWDGNSLRDISGVTKVGRASNRTTLGGNAEYNTLWRATMGITPFIKESGSSLIVQQAGTLAHAAYTVSKNWIGSETDRWYFNTVYYPYTNLEYAITGKYYDLNTYNADKTNINNMFASSNVIASPELNISHAGSHMYHSTAGKIIDITISYLSDPLAIAISANPTDDRVYDLANNKDGGQVFYWHNRREAITFLDSASAMVPAGENDIPVSLMVGYILGGTVAYGDSGDSATVDPTSIMNNGIVFLRAGTYNAEKHNSSNSETGEYKATDNTGYKLNQESNTFHQFYYLNSRARVGVHGENLADPSKGKHIGNLYGAEYWQTNRHILPKSITGGAPSNGNDGSYEYLRAHPMSDTKVNCVAWGTTWDGHPEAMWGTENGTVLSWWVDTIKIQTDNDATNWNDRSVDAEIQSYKWIDNVNDKTYAVKTSDWSGTVGSAQFNSGSNAGAAFTPGSDRFKYFYDKGTQATSFWSVVGFINTLETINDIEYADDLWVAAGDQSDRAPADYSASGEAGQNNPDLKANEYRKTIRAYSDYPSNTGRGGSWINVRYWVDLGTDGKHSTTNATYHWRAVQISKQPNYNIVQINYVNGMWVATGYIDGTNGGYNNDEYDEGEKTVICWTYDPLVPCGAEGGWSENVKMYDGKNQVDMNAMGGINSVATRD